MKTYISEQELVALINQLNVDALKSKVDKGEHAKSSRTNQDGWVQVKDQAIFVEDPKGWGKPPAIRPVPPVKLFVNDQEITRSIVVTSEDSIRWEIEQPPLFDITVSDDKLAAYFHLHAPVQYAWQLVDTDPSLHVLVEAREDKRNIIKSIDFNEIVAEIGRMGIKANVDTLAIRQELQNPTYTPVLIAKGKAPIPSKDAKLEIFFPEQVENRFFEVNGTVDYRSHLHIPSVKKGDVIAKKIPAFNGMPGYDVYGNALLPKLPKDIPIVTKPSVELTADGELIALTNGRPRMMGTTIKVFEISNEYIVTGDVNLETGNIVFSGDVIVYGNVTDNMIIESLGNVYVYGGVFNATITATGSIHVRQNVMGSRLFSGYYGVLFNRVYQTAKKLTYKMDLLYQASLLLADQLEQRKHPVKWGQIYLLLVENKFNDLSGLLQELLSLLPYIRNMNRHAVDQIMEHAATFLHKPKFVETASPHYIHNLISLLREVYYEVEQAQEERAQLIINKCYNSRLKSNGDIMIRSDGVIQSRLYSNGNIVFQYQDAVCRGSMLDAGGSIRAKIVGGETGAKMVLKAKRSVTVKKMYSGQVVVGNNIHIIDQPVENKLFTSFGQIDHLP